MIVDPAENASAHLEEHSDGCASMVIATISIVAAAPDDGPSLVITLVTMIGVIVTTLVATSVVAGTSVLHRRQCQVGRSCHNCPN
jgi:uncharacterized membrane protein YozB (DUF420 family)